MIIEYFVTEIVMYYTAGRFAVLCVKLFIFTFKTPPLGTGYFYNPIQLADSKYFTIFLSLQVYFTIHIRKISPSFLIIRKISQNDNTTIWSCLKKPVI